MIHITVKYMPANVSQLTSTKPGVNTMTIITNAMRGNVANVNNLTMNSLFNRLSFCISSKRQVHILIN